MRGRVSTVACAVSSRSSREEPHPRSYLAARYSRFATIIVSLIDVATRPNVINIDDVFVSIVPKDDAKVADPDALIACPFPRHLDRAWVRVGGFHQMCKCFLYPFSVRSRKSFKVAHCAPMNDNLAHGIASSAT